MDDHHFLVVGGTRGTGRALVQRLLDTAGYRVSVFGRHHEPADGAPRLASYQVDVTDTAALRSALDMAVAKDGKFHSVVFMQRNRAEQDEFEADLAVALTATKNAIEHLVAQAYFSRAYSTNSIVMVSSIADHYVAPEQDVGYHVSKAGLAHLARYYALTLGGLGIRVNSVSPCVVIKESAREFYSKNGWLTDRFERFIPLGRAGNSEDIVNVISFLISEQSSYVTGQNIVVDGGLTLRSHESIIRDFARGE